MRHKAIQSSAAILLFAVAFGLWMAQTGTGFGYLNRKHVQQRLKQDVAVALQNSTLSRHDREKFLTARAELKELVKAQREGKPVEHQRIATAAETMKTIIASPAVRPDDRKRIEQSIEILDALRREERARVRREALVAQLGYPAGLLASMFLSN